MPIYEYYCQDCQGKFEALRPMSQADEPIACGRCRGNNTKRVISLFSAVSRESGGESRTVAGGSSCASCTASSCAGCRL
ncbi:MAG: FmdB family zinc ribbon protein [Anaerolineae bacterium]